MNDLKLNKLVKNQLNEKEKSQLIGGAVASCGCGCNYAGSGGSSTTDNRCANIRGNLCSPGVQASLYIVNTATGAAYTITGQPCC